MHNHLRKISRSSGSRELNILKPFIDFITFEDGQL